MTELDSGRLSGPAPERPAERPAKRPAQPRAKKTSGTAASKAVKPEAAAAPATPQKRAPATARSSKARAEAGPNLSDWLSLALIVLLVMLAVGLYQWRERPGAHPLQGHPPAAQLRGDPAFSHCAALPTHRRLSA